MSRIQQNLASREAGLVLDPFANRLRDGAWQSEQIGCHQNCAMSFPIFESESFRINVLLHPFIRLYARSVPGHRHWCLGRDFDRCQSRFPFRFNRVNVQKSQCGEGE